MDSVLAGSVPVRVPAFMYRHCRDAEDPEPADAVHAAIARATPGASAEMRQKLTTLWGRVMQAQERGIASEADF